MTRRSSSPKFDFAPRPAVGGPEIKGVFRHLHASASTSPTESTTSPLLNSIIGKGENGHALWSGRLTRIGVARRFSCQGNRGNNRLFIPREKSDNPCFAVGRRGAGKRGRARTSTSRPPRGFCRRGANARARPRGGPPRPARPKGGFPLFPQRRNLSQGGRSSSTGLGARTPHTGGHAFPRRRTPSRFAGVLEKGGRATPSVAQFPQRGSGRSRGRPTDNPPPHHTKPPRSRRERHSHYTTPMHRRNCLPRGNRTGPRGARLPAGMPPSSRRRETGPPSSTAFPGAPRRKLRKGWEGASRGGLPPLGFYPRSPRIFGPPEARRENPWVFKRAPGLGYRIPDRICAARATLCSDGRGAGGTRGDGFDRKTTQFYR